jgi:hypothetical protein
MSMIIMMKHRVQFLSNVTVLVGKTTKNCQRLLLGVSKHYATFGFTLIKRCFAKKSLHSVLCTNYAFIRRTWGRGNIEKTSIIFLATLFVCTLTGSYTFIIGLIKLGRCIKTRDSWEERDGIPKEWNLNF